MIWRRILIILRGVMDYGLGVPARLNQSRPVYPLATPAPPQRGVLEVRRAWRGWSYDDLLIM